MKNNKETKPTPKDVLSELQTLVAEAEISMAGALSENSGEAFRGLRRRFVAAQERFSDACLETRKRVVAGAQYTDEAIREHPYTSLALAAGIGFLVGALVSRRTR